MGPFHITSKGAGQGWFLPVFAFFALASLATIALWPRTVPAKKHVENCVGCHSDSKLRRINPKLAKYYGNWERSIHSQVGVTCVDCHGGNESAPTKVEAHDGAALGAGDLSGVLDHRRIPKLCATCHASVFRQYQESTHYNALQSAQLEAKSPNCVTCHGSMNTFLLNVNTVREACAECHDPTDGPDTIPFQAERVLSTLLSIWRYSGYLAQQEESEKALDNIRRINDRIKELNASWHTFDLDTVEQDAQALLADVQVRARHILKDRAERSAQRRKAGTR